MSENLVNAAAELQKQMKMVKERNENIIKAHNSGLSAEGILEQFDINQETLDSVLKSAKRNGLLKSPVMEEKKPRRGRPPLKPQEETKPLLKETDLKKKPKPEKKPKQDAIDENLEKVSDDAKKAIESFAPEKKETFIEAGQKVISNAAKEFSKLGANLNKQLSENITKSIKNQLPHIDTPSIPGHIFESSNELIILPEMPKPEVTDSTEILENDLNKAKISIAEKDAEIERLKSQIERFNHLQDLSLLLMKNTLALVDQAQEQRLEGRQ